MLSHLSQITTLVKLVLVVSYVMVVVKFKSLPTFLSPHSWCVSEPSASQFPFHHIVRWSIMGRFNVVAHL